MPSRYRITTRNEDNNTATPQLIEEADDQAATGRAISHACRQFEAACRLDSVENVEAHYSADGRISLSKAMGTGIHGDRYTFTIERLDDCARCDGDGWIRRPGGSDEDGPHPGTICGTCNKRGQLDHRARQRQEQAR